MGMLLTWDPPKRLANLAKHGFDFADVGAVFTQPLVRTVSSRNGERRIKCVGLLGGVIVVVVLVVRGGGAHIISLRKAKKSERKAYRHQQEKGAGNP